MLVKGEKEVAVKKEYFGIMKLITMGKIDLAIKSLDNYLTKYPENNFGLKLYAMILRQQGKYDEALNLLAQADQSQVYIIREKALCYYYAGKYQQALEVINSMRVHNNASYFIKSLCEIELGIYKEPPKDKQGYLLSQAINYNEEKAIEHIKRHTKDKNASYFDDDASIEEIYHNVTRLLPKSKITISDTPFLTYTFFIKNIGWSVINQPINHLRVVALPAHLSIITMYPIEDIKTNSINNYEQMMKLDTKTEKKPQYTFKRESQIEKFNRRYSRNEKPSIQ